MKKLLIFIGLAFIYWFFIRKPEADENKSAVPGSFSPLLPSSTAGSNSQPTGTNTTQVISNPGTTSTSSTNSGSNGEPPAAKPQVQPAFSFNIPKSAFV